MDICISELQSFNLSKSLISSKLLSELSASDIKVWVKPLDFACASLVQFSCVTSAVDSMSGKQSSNCEESMPVKIVISWSKLLVKVVFVVQCTKFLYIVVAGHLMVLVVLMGKV